MNNKISELKSTLLELEHTGDYQAMLPLLQEVAELTKSEYSNVSPEYGAAISDLGGALRDVGRFEEAEKAFHQAQASISASLVYCIADKYGNII